MIETQVNVGSLLSLHTNLFVDNSAPRLSIYEGINFVGCNNLNLLDKRVNQKHISLHASADGSAEVQVEGSNPVVVKSGVQRRRLCSQEKCLITHGDIIKLIPGSYLFKYVTDGSHLESSLKSDVGISTKGKRKVEDDFLAVKRNHQILKDEAVARALQCVEVKSSVHDETLAVAKSCCTESYTATTLAYSKGAEVIRDFNVPKDSLPFYLSTYASPRNSYMGKFFFIYY